LRYLFAAVGWWERVICFEASRGHHPAEHFSVSSTTELVLLAFALLQHRRPVLFLFQSSTASFSYNAFRIFPLPLGYLCFFFALQCRRM